MNQKVLGVILQIQKLDGNTALLDFVKRILHEKTEQNFF